MAEENNYPPLSVSNNSNVHAVRTLQTLLNNHGATLYVDGRYAIGTDRAVAAFQQSKKLDVVGYVDEKTWKALSVFLGKTFLENQVLLIRYCGWFLILLQKTTEKT